MNNQNSSSDPTTYHPADHTPLVLIVEDDNMLSKMYSEKFIIDGYETHIAKDGEEAYEFLKKNHVDCVLLDLHIPKYDGLTALEKLKKEKLELPPTIALTNLAETKLVERATALGVKEYLIKAMLTPEAVVQKVKAYTLHHA